MKNEACNKISSPLLHKREIPAFCKGILKGIYTFLMLFFIFFYFIDYSGAQEITLKNYNVVLIPFENLTEYPEALEKAVPLLRNELNKRGLFVLEEKDVLPFLTKYEIRRRGSLSLEDIKKIKSDTKADFIFTGSILNYTEAENPRFALHARLLDAETGKIVWSGYSSLTGYDFETVFGLGIIKSIDELIPHVIERLFNDFTLYKSVYGGKRVAVIPFKNNSSRFWIGRAVASLLLTHMSRMEGIEPVEPGEVKKMLIELNIRENGEITYQAIDELRNRGNIDYIILGSVEEYLVAQRALDIPRVFLTARLIDTGTKRIISIFDQEMDGEDGIIVLDFGRLRSEDKVAFRAAGKMLRRIKERVW